MAIEVGGPIFEVGVLSRDYGTCNNSMAFRITVFPLICIAYNFTLFHLRKLMCIVYEYDNITVTVMLTTSCHDYHVCSGNKFSSDGKEQIVKAVRERNSVGSMAELILPSFI